MPFRCGNVGTKAARDGPIQKQWEPRPYNLSYKQTPLSIGFTVSDQLDSQDVSHLREVNAELTRSLKRCRVLLDDCRAKLAANSNDPTAFDNDDEEDADESGRA
jgi:hypothetical protein